VTGVEEETGDVFTVNVAVDAPAKMVMLDCTVAAALLLDSETTAPPPGAGELSVTVPWEELPPTTLAGLRTRVDSAAGTGSTVSEAVLVTPLYTAEIVAGVDEDTAEVLTLNVAVEAPPGTVTLPDTVAAALLLDRETTAPPEGAAKVSVTVP